MNIAVSNPTSLLPKMAKLAILMSFIVIGLWNISQFFHAGYQILWTSLLSIAACALLLTFIKDRIESSLWLWIMLFVFIMGYYLKLLLMSFQYTTYKFDVFYATEMGWLTTDAMLDANLWMTVGFVTFCIVGSILASMSCTSLDGQRQSWSRLQVSAIGAKKLLLVMTGLYALTLIIPVIYGFGQMGLEHHRLPFRLDAIVTRMRVDILPALFLLLIWLLDRKQHRGIWVIVLILYVGLTLIDSAMRGSRSAMLSMALPTLLLWVISHKLTRQRIIALVALIIMTVAFYPVFSDIRLARIRENTVGASTVVESFERLASLETRNKTLEMMAMRVGGLEGLLHDLNNAPEKFESSRLLWLLNNDVMGTYQTHEIVGIHYDWVDGRSPGLLGAFVLVAGPWGIIPLLTLYMLIIWLAWSKVASLSIAPVAMVYLSYNFLMYTSEGIFGIQSPIAWLVTIVILNYIYAWLVQSAPASSPNRFRPGVFKKPNMTVRKNMHLEKASWGASDARRTWRHRTSASRKR